MKPSDLRIDDGCSVGNMSVVLYDSHMQHGAVLSAFATHEGRDRTAGHPVAWYSHRENLRCQQSELSEAFQFARGQQHFSLFLNTLNFNYRGSLGYPG